MSDRTDFLRELMRELASLLARLVAALATAVRAILGAAYRYRTRLVVIALLAFAAYRLYESPPFVTVGRGEILVRENLFDGSVDAWVSGTVPVLPRIHQVRRYSTRDQIYRPTQSASATGAAPFQSTEGLSIGVELTVRWAIDRGRVARMSKDFPDDLNEDLVRPALEGIIYPLFARHSVREIFSRQRSEIQSELAAALGPKLNAVGLVLRGVDMGKVDLPPDFRVGMEKLLAEELETEKIRFTLQLKESLVRQTQLEAEADKVRRQEAAEAAAQEQMIAARAQEESMRTSCPSSSGRSSSAGSKPRPRRPRAFAPPKGPPKRSASKPRARRTRGRSSPRRKPSVSTCLARRAPSRWRARAIC
jgi:regulator of protease activity HflC (stomatin/prohibitin superfamily)